MYILLFFYRILTGIKLLFTFTIVLFQMLGSFARRIVLFLKKWHLTLTA